MSSIKKSPGARTFGGDPAAYDAARPLYPGELFHWLEETCALGPGTRCFEIGAGAGLATRPIAALGIESLLAIEPDGALAQYLEDHSGSNVSVVTCRLEDAQLEEAYFDFGFAATSFHWVKRMAGLKACIRALKPGGWFAMWWSIYHNTLKPDAFGSATAHLFEGLEQSPRMSGGIPFALNVNSRLGEMRKAGFVETQHRAFTAIHLFTADQIAALYETFSRVQIAPHATRQRLTAEVRRIASLDFGGSIYREIVTSAFIGRRS